MSDEPNDSLRAASVLLTQDAPFCADEAALAAGELALAVVDQASPLVRTAFLSLLGRALIERGRYLDGLSCDPARVGRRGAYADRLCQVPSPARAFVRPHGARGRDGRRARPDDCGAARHGRLQRPATGAWRAGSFRSPGAVSMKLGDCSNKLIAHVTPRRHGSELAAYAGFAAAAQGDRDGATRWAQHARDVSVTIEPSVIAAMAIAPALTRQYEFRSRLRRCHGAYRAARPRDYSCSRDVYAAEATSRGRRASLGR